MWNKDEVRGAADEIEGRLHNAMNREQTNSSGVFIAGLFVGAAIGAGIGLLFAPRKGSELREQVSDAAMNAGKTVSKTVEDLSKRGRTAYARVRDVASAAGEEIDRAAGGNGA